MSERSIVTRLQPSMDLDGRCYVSCFLPSDQLAPVARIVGEYHTGGAPPLVAVQDRNATLELFQPTFSQLDWSLFDPGQLSWAFKQAQYIEHLKTLKPQTIPQPPVRQSA